MLKKILPLTLLTLCFACDRSDDTTVIPPGGWVCGASSGLSVCDLQNVDGERHPNLDDPISISDVVVTTGTTSASVDMNGNTTLAVFYVQDQQTDDKLQDRFSGIAVTYRPGTVDVPSIGSIIDVEGKYNEFSRNMATAQRQIEATSVSMPKGTAPVRVKELSVDDVSPLYEGSVIRLPNVVTTAINPAGAAGNQIFGFEINQKVIVTTVFARYFSDVGEEFNSVAGVYRVGTAAFDAGFYLLTPRNDDDIQPKNPIPRVSSITAVQDPGSPDAPAETCNNDQPTSERRCPRISLSNVVVTASGGYVSSNLRAMWLQDPAVTDGRYAGIKLVYSADDTMPGAGSLVNVEGEVIEWFGGTQIQFADVTSVGTMTATSVTVNPTDIPRTADGGNPYEGVLVTIRDVQVTQRCTEDSNFRDHGNWVVTGDVIVGTAFPYDYNGDLRPSNIDCDMMAGGNCSCAANSRPNDQRMDNDQFAEITGVLDFSFNELKINPRDNGDLVLR